MFHSRDNDKFNTDCREGDLSGKLPRPLKSSFFELNIIFRKMCIDELFVEGNI